MSFCRAGCRTGAGRTLHGTYTEVFRLGDALKTRQNIEERAHVGWFFLHPDDFTRVRMFVDGGGDFRLGQRIKLIQKKDGGRSVMATAAFGAQFVSDFAAGDQDTFGVVNVGVTDKVLETRLGKIFERRRRIGMAEHAFWREDYQRLAPRAKRLATQQVKILCRGRRLADLHVAFGSELHETLDARAGMLRPLTLIAMW